MMRKLKISILTATAASARKTKAFAKAVIDVAVGLLVICVAFLVATYASSFAGARLFGRD